MVQDTSTLGVVARFRAHTSPLRALAFDPAGRLLVTASVVGNNLNVFLLSPASLAGQPVAFRHLYRLRRGVTAATIQSLAFSGDSRYLAASTAHGTTHVFAINPLGGVVTPTSHADAAREAGCAGPHAPSFPTQQSRRRSEDSRGARADVSGTLGASPAKMFGTSGGASSPSCSIVDALPPLVEGVTALARVHAGSASWQAGVSSMAAAAGLKGKTTQQQVPRLAGPERCSRPASLMRSFEWPPACILTVNSRMLGACACVDSLGNLHGSLRNSHFCKSCTRRAICPLDAQACHFRCLFVLGLDAACATRADKPDTPLLWSEWMNAAPQCFADSFCGSERLPRVHSAAICVHRPPSGANLHLPVALTDLISHRLALLPIRCGMRGQEVVVAADFCPDRLERGAGGARALEVALAGGGLSRLELLPWVETVAASDASLPAQVPERQREWEQGLRTGVQHERASTFQRLLKTDICIYI